MSIPWLQVWETTVFVALIWSTAFTIFIVTLPSRAGQIPPEEISDNEFTEQHKQESDQSGYSVFLHHKSDAGRFRFKTSVQIVVLGDIGRSPRMQYHALSIARHGGCVDIVGYLDSDVHPAVQASRFINVVPIAPFPSRLQTNNKALFLLLAPLKVLWQVLSLYYTLAYRSRASKWMLVQNPPSIPTLAVAQIICFFRNTRLAIDWHNFGYSILALRLGDGHPLVRLSKRYEAYFSQGATAHFCVTNAMARVLKQKWGITALPLHDRPPHHFQPFDSKQRATFLRNLPQLNGYSFDTSDRPWRLIVSSTSWTPDEDFSILLDALVTYSASVSSSNSKLPKIVAIITGKGPQKDYYLEKIRELNNCGKLSHATITTAWLSTQDYASLLASADLGISLHTSSSGVDLPMKVVDMFGVGLPVAGWSKYEAWPELVQEGVNGRGFESAQGLSNTLQDLFGGNEEELRRLRSGALRECTRRWEDEWMPVAGRLFQLDS